MYNSLKLEKFLSPESTKTLVYTFQCDVTFVPCKYLLFGVPKYQTDRLKDVRAKIKKLKF